MSAERLPGLDGIRALAIALVLLFHLNLAGIGWVGVQLFFVLSGFLITRVLLASRDGRGLGAYLKHFYGRRALRIFPIYYLYLVLLAVAALTLLRDDVQAQRALAQWPAAALYLHNWQAMAPGHDDSYYLAHFWTLAVEEQFYLLWPLLVYRLGTSALRRLLLALVLAGPLLRLAIFVLWPLPPPAIYEAVAICTLSQLDAFALGGLLNLLPAGLARGRAGWMLGAVALLALGLGVAVNGWGVAPAGALGAPLVLGYPNLLPRWFQFAWGYSLVNLVGALLIWAVVHEGWGRRAWQARPVAALGRISYGVYVLHFPLAHLLSRLLVPIHEATGLGLHASILLGAPLYLLILLTVSGLSYRLFERRFLALKERYFPS